MMEKLNSSISVDQRLAEFDVRGSIAYAKALAKAGILTTLDLDKIIGGLEEVPNGLSSSQRASNGTDNQPSKGLLK